MRKKYILSIIAIVLICSMAGAGTMAWFTSRATSEENSISAGTLILGTGDVGTDSNDQNLVFNSVTFGSMEPGEPPIQVQRTKLKNVGSLPFYLYRITASQLTDMTIGETNNEKDDTELDDVLNIEITMCDPDEAVENGEKVFEGKLSELVEENGGFFDPVYGINPQDVKEMVITAHMDPNANNYYQGLSMNCDFTVYAAQNNMPVNGEGSGSGNKSYLGSTELFSVEGYNSGNYVCFDWDWTPNDDQAFGSEFYKINIKHETGDDSTSIEEGKDYFFWITIDRHEQVVSSDGIDEDDIDVDWGGDVVRINRSAFPSSWDGFEVKLSGKQNNNPDVKSIGYQYWSLDR